MPAEKTRKFRLATLAAHDENDDFAVLLVVLAVSACGTAFRQKTSIGELRFASETANKLKPSALAPVWDDALTSANALGFSLFFIHIAARTY